MSLDMASFAQWNNIKPMLFGIAIGVMILFCWLFATCAKAYRYVLNCSFGNSLVDSIASSYFMLASKSIRLLLCPSSGRYFMQFLRLSSLFICSLSVYSVIFNKALSVSFSIFLIVLSLSLFYFRSITPNFFACFTCRFKNTIRGFSSIFVKTRYILCFTTSYTQLFHISLLNKKPLAFLDSVTRQAPEAFIEFMNYGLQYYYLAGDSEIIA